MISPETIDRIKRKADIVGVISESMRLQKRGRSYIGLCPFHQEKSPSFHVNDERGFYYCFGCKESGSVIDFVIKMEGRSFNEAIRYLAERSGIAIVENQNADESNSIRVLEKQKEELSNVCLLAAQFFEDQLWGSAHANPHPFAEYAWKELESRSLLPTHIHHPDDPISTALRSFRLGYAPYGWHELFQFFQKKSISPALLESLGLIIPKSNKNGYYDRFRHRLMFAVIDRWGKVVGFSGRALDPPSQDKVSKFTNDVLLPQTDQAKYVNSPESVIYHKGDQLFGLFQARNAIRQRGEAILVEGNFDVLSLYARGIQNVVAPLGTAFTSAQAILLKRYTPKVVLCFDGDLAGKKAVSLSRVPCKQADLSVKVASLPDGKDPDVWVREIGTEGFVKMIQQTQGLLEYLIENTLEPKPFSGSSFADQMERIKATIQLIAEENDPTLKSMAKTLADRLSSRLIVMGKSPGDLRQLERWISQTLNKSPNKSSNTSNHSLHHTKMTRETADLSIERAMWGCYLDFPELLLDPEAKGCVKYFNGDLSLVVALLTQMVVDSRVSISGNEFWKENSVKLNEFLAQTPNSIHSFTIGRITCPIFEKMEDAKLELIANGQKLKNMTIQEENAKTVDQIHMAEKTGNIEMENELLRKLQSRAINKLELP